MKNIPTDQIEDGMILAEDACGQSGSILMNKGMKLTSSLKRRLKNWGVEEVFIEGEEDSAEDKSQDNDSEEKKDNYTEKFSEHMDDPVMKRLYNAIIAVEFGGD